MRLVQVIIQKFRAIREAEIRVGSELALVGQNSAGKSSVLRALNAFFNFPDEREAFEAGRHAFMSSATSVIEVLFTAVPASCTLPRTTTGGNEVCLQLRIRKKPGWQVKTSTGWEKASDNLHEELARHVRYIYVPLRRDHEVSAWGEAGLLRTAVETWVRQHTARRDRISPKVASLAGLIQRRAFSGLSQQLRRFAPIDGKFKFSLEYAHDPDYSLLLRDIVLRVSEGSTTVDLQDCGSGTQSMAAFALYSYLAELEGSTYILGIEEPEQNLHPQAQRALMENLRSLPLQVLFTTHSTVLLDEMEHEEVVLCRRVESDARGVEVTTTQLSASFWNRTGLDRVAYYQFYRRRNSEFFFANFVILVESPVDGELVRELLAMSGTEAVKHGVSILSLDGVQSLPYAYHLLSDLGISFATVVDKDYFLPYLNDELESSRNNGGFPRFRKIFKTDALVDVMVSDPGEQAQLLDLLHSNHSRAMDILEKANVFCFKWSLEVDLVNSATARGLFFQQLQVPAAQQSTHDLLVGRKKQLKKLKNLLPVLRALRPANLPNSYKRLRKVLPPQIRRAANLS
ncbi:MAG: AAA family ATPase [Alphaproteobacteria bacterium]|nr:AAA family ATPase [Alphaproteobacteria bacterium]